MTRARRIIRNQFILQPDQTKVLTSPPMTQAMYPPPEKASNHNNAAKRTSLLDLPPELHLAIAALLLLNDRMNLRCISPYFIHIISRLTHADLLEAEKDEISIKEGLLTCKFCLRLRSYCQFDDRYEGRDSFTRRGIPPRGVRDRLTIEQYPRGGSKAHERFCIECGFNPPEGHKGYEKGVIVLCGGSRQIFCH